MIANIPNILTIIRILLVPVFLFFITNDMLAWSIAVFVAAGLTDALDGLIARTFNMRTEFGAIIDPIADKFLLSSAFIALTFKGFVPLWLCVPVILRDIVILAGVALLRFAGRRVNIMPTIFGKMTTAFQIITVFYAMAFDAKSGGDMIFTSLAILTALITIYTGFNYAWREFKLQTSKGVNS